MSKNILITNNREFKNSLKILALYGNYGHFGSLEDLIKVIIIDLGKGLADVKGLDINDVELIKTNILENEFKG